MSIFTSVFHGIDKAAHSTVAWLEKQLAALVKAAPKIEHVIDAGLAYVGPVLELSLTTIGEGDAAAKVVDVVREAQGALNAASALVTDFGPSPTAASIFNSVQSNLKELLTAGHVTNTQSVAAVQKAVDEIGLIGAAVGEAATAISGAAAAKGA